jgi:integrase/recombinase XerD
MPREAKFLSRSTIQIAKHLRAPATRIENIVRKAHLNCDDTCKLMSEVRRRLNIVRPSRRKCVVDRLSPSETDRFLRAAYASPCRSLLQTLFQTGARINEIIAIRVNDFRTKDATILIRKGKSPKKQAIPVLPELARALEAHVGNRRDCWLFETCRARAYSARRVQQIVAGIARMVGITKQIHPRLLRHSIVRQLLDGGMPLGQIQGFLGQEKTEKTRTYAEAT